MLLDKKIFSGLVFVILLSIIITLPALSKAEPFRRLNLEVSGEKGKEVVQLRQLAEVLDWTLFYSAEEKAVNIVYGGRTTRLEIHAEKYEGQKLEVSPYIRGGRTYIGLKMINLLLSDLEMGKYDLLTEFKIADDVYRADTELDLEFGVYNLSGKKLTLNFNSGQLYDLYLRQGGQELWRWSRDRIFTMALVSKELAAGTGLSYQVELPAGLELPSGQYNLEVELNTAQPIKIGMREINVK